MVKIKLLRWRRARKSQVLTLAAAICVMANGPALPAEEGPGDVLLGVRILTIAGAPLAWKVRLPPDCTRCRLLLGRATSGSNPRGFYFHAVAPSREALAGSMHVDVDPSRVRGVLVSYTDADLPAHGFARPQSRAMGAAPVPYRRDAHGIAFTVPTQPQGPSLPPDDLGDVTQNYTYIETPGVYIRIAHPDPAQRGGRYASGRWPATEATAALNLEFATREAIEKLGLVSRVQRKGAETIMLMNFDTNYPTLGAAQAHEDWPPHWHMHLYWQTSPKVRRVSHFYISKAGLLTRDMISDLRPGTTNSRAPDRWMKPGEADETRAPDSTLLYSQTINKDGSFTLASPDGACTIKPAGRGFADGAKLNCNTMRQETLVKAVDNVEEGRLSLFLNRRLAQTYRYDRDTGDILPPRRPAQQAHARR